MLASDKCVGISMCEVEKKFYKFDSRLTCCRQLPKGNLLVGYLHFTCKLLAFHSYVTCISLVSFLNIIFSFFNDSLLIAYW